MEYIYLTGFPSNPNSLINRLEARTAGDKIALQRNPRDILYEINTRAHVNFDDCWMLIEEEPNITIS